MIMMMMVVVYIDHDPKNWWGSEGGRKEGEREGSDKVLLPSVLGPNNTHTLTQKKGSDISSHTRFFVRSFVALITGSYLVPRTEKTVIVNKRRP